MNFDNVVFIAKKTFTKGYLLRETRNSVVFEEYYTEKNVDFIAEFLGKSIKIDEDLEECIKRAREYVGDQNAVIYVDLNRWNQK